jgi:hypothetical protein
MDELASLVCLPLFVFHSNRFGPKGPQDYYPQDYDPWDYYIMVYTP